MYGTHSQKALDDPTRPSSAAGLGIQLVFALFVVKYCIFYFYFRPSQ